MVRLLPPSCSNPESQATCIRRRRFLSCTDFLLMKIDAFLCFGQLRRGCSRSMKWENLGTMVRGLVGTSLGVRSVETLSRNVENKYRVLKIFCSRCYLTSYSSYICKCYCLHDRNSQSNRNQNSGIANYFESREFILSLAYLIDVFKLS